MPEAAALAPVLQEAVERSGNIRGARVAAIVMEWALATVEYGELGAGVSGFGHITAAARDVARWSGRSERTIWRDIKRFRDVFPEEDSPERRASVVAQALGARKPARRRQLGPASRPGRASA